MKITFRSTSLQDKPNQAAYALVAMLITLALSGCGVFRFEARVDPLEPQEPVATTVATIAATTASTAETATPLPAMLATASPVPPVDNAPTPTPVPYGSTATYQDERVGLLLDLPADWHWEVPSAEVRALSNYATTFTSWRPSLGGGGSGVPEGGTKLDLMIVQSSASSLEAAIAERRAQTVQNSETIRSEEQWTLAGGLAATRWHVEGLMGEAAVVITVYNGYTISLYGYGDYALFDTIARTLRTVTNNQATSAEPNAEPAAVVASDVQAVKIVTVAGTANVRSGPGENYPAVTTLAGNLTVQVDGVSENDQWWHLAGCRAENSQRPAASCWVSSDPNVTQIVRPLGPSGATIQATTRRAVLVTTNAEAAPLYAAPDANAHQVAQLFSGMQFPVAGISSDGAWYLIAGCTGPLNETLAECWIAASAVEAVN